MVRKSDIDEGVKSGALIIGFKSVVKALNEGVCREVFVSSNGKSFVSKLKLIAGEVPIVLVEESSRELGVRCKKPFSIAVLGLRALEIEKKPKKKLVSKKPTKKKASSSKKSGKKLK